HVVLLVEGGGLFQSLPGDMAVQKQKPVPGVPVDTGAQRAGPVIFRFFRVKEIGKNTGGILKHFLQNIVHHILQVIVMQVKSSPVDAGAAADLRHGDFQEGRMLQHGQDSLADSTAGLPGALVIPGGFLLFLTNHGNLLSSLGRSKIPEVFSGFRRQMRGESMDICAGELPEGIKNEKMNKIRKLLIVISGSYYIINDRTSQQKAGACAAGC